MAEKYQPFGMFGPERNSQKAYEEQKLDFILHAVSCGKSQKDAEERWIQACRESARIAAKEFFKQEQRERNKRIAIGKRQRLKKQLRRGI